MTNQFIWTSSSAPPKKRLDQFAEYIDRIHLGWDLNAYDQQIFDAKIQGRNLGEISITDVVTEPIYGQRREHNIAQQNEEYYSFISILEGEEFLMQGGNETVLQAGDCALWNTSRPATFSSNTRMRQVSIFVPCSIVERRIPNAADYCGKSFDGNIGFGALLRSYFQTIPTIYNEIKNDDALCLIEPIIEMFNGALNNQPLGSKTTSYKQKLLTRIQNYIIDNVTDPSLNPKKIADEFNFSLRYLHKIFSEAGKTVANFIRQQRLMNAKVDLDKPTTNNISITELAFRHGFNDPAHFSKIFRQEFNISPRKYRQRIHKST